MPSLSHEAKPRGIVARSVTRPGNSALHVGIVARSDTRPGNSALNVGVSPLLSTAPNIVGHKHFPPISPHPGKAGRGPKAERLGEASFARVW